MTAEQKARLAELEKSEKAGSLTPAETKELAELREDA